ncbi:Htaa domain-containing protein [Nocardia nova SH22a]|uniref:Htaa domain-containing protein n=1 Tax=Nocardia nova SH22a TaxID=1415166 RepID=W5T8A3_9NOCA|nr:HtaA domain-containing protein [Nocardia nova]AHH15213.1 Htaa domain-containing protein [Nocardia nova SH22a]
MNALMMRGLAVACTALAGAGIVQAAPAAADTTPSIEVFAADGTTPLGAAVLHPGDRIVVRGHGFDPASNTSGLPVPVPPGVPHGTFVTFGAFAPHWKPSEGAPAATRAADRSAVAWALSDSALRRVPQAPLDLQRTVRKQWVPLDDDGNFTATLTVKQPTTVPADAAFGVYTYAAADAVNAAQELSVPVHYDPTPGPDTPRPPAADLRWAVSNNFAPTVTGPLQGTLSGSGGAGVDNGTLTFELDRADLDPTSGLGTIRYRGTAVAATRFHLGEIALADPWIEFTPTGTWLSAETSTSDTIGADSLQRVRLARLDTEPTAGQQDWTDIPTHIENSTQPASLRLLALGPTAPITFHR